MKALHRFVCLIAVAAGLSALHVFAQDVTVTDPVWALPDPAPQQIPNPKSRLRPSFPDEMRAATESGYVIITRYVDSDGKSLSLRAAATHPAYQRAVEAEFRDWEMSGAKRNGQPIPGEIWIAAIFNPKTASTKGPNATPRLLAVTPIISPRPPFNKGGSRVVTLQLKLDNTGAILESAPTAEINEKAAAAIKAALQNWRFAPARKDGQPIASEFTLNVVCQNSSPVDRGDAIPPKVIKQVSPDYPPAMRASKMRGEVALSFDVDTDGSVQNPIVVRSNNPGFDEAALQCIRRWKFKPGLRGDQPTKAKLSVTIHFNIVSDNLSFEANDAYNVSDRANQSKLPPELRYDTPAKIRGTALPVYPFEFRRNKVRGSAKVALVIDTEGHVVQMKVLEATRPEFGLATLAAAETFTFDPALRKSTPVTSILRFTQEFSSKEPSDNVADDLASLEKRHPEKIANAKTLDVPLRPISQKKPVFPRSLIGKVSEGKTVVEMLIDETGHVRLPRVVSATDELLGYAALQAVAAWIFDPPKVGGNPVVTRVYLPINFSGPPKSSQTAVAPETPPISDDLK